MASSSTSVTFNGTQDTVAASWTPISSSFGSFYGLQLTSGGFVGIWLTAVANGSATVNTTARFSGTVYLTFFDI